MTLAIINSRASFGIEAPPVTIEVHLSPGLPSLSMVGLPETAIKESKDRVRSALINSGFEFPARRITINLAPADLPKKEGGRFDLPIALGILIASKQIEIEDVSQYEFAGELALDGKLRPFSGALPLALATKKAERILILSKESAYEAGLVSGIEIFALGHLLDVCRYLVGSKVFHPYKMPLSEKAPINGLDISDVYGQNYAKRALEIAAAGGHSLFMVGPPGVGKTMLANRLITILPEMNDDEALETATIYSICGKKDHLRFWQVRPFRAPHHTASSVALVGGSSPPRPGEISLAHNGVLFLDELLEFNRNVLEALREPLESKHVTISRAAHQARFPAKFQLVVAMNPCPCGYFGDNRSICNCTLDQIKRYRARVSGPFLDRIDLWLTVPSLPKNILSCSTNSETSQQIRVRVIKAREYAISRQGKINSELTNKEMERFCFITAKDQEFLEGVVDKFKLSTRSYHRIIKISRTIADLDAEKGIKDRHIQEAISYRRGK
ncbi:MAG: YifB family Mg chelatase-like AAA ATPase [Gammaproteobacteria bacterium]|nr:YifB family Mg chelatase-like AAA ATPase [Gammaproteobacteria bacterium]